MCGHIFITSMLDKLFYRILQVLRRLFGLFSANLRRIATEKMGKGMYSCTTKRCIVVRLEGDATRLSTSAEPSGNVQEDTFLNP